ncbi:MAG: nucleoside-diphosphate kinase [archaeon]
MHTEKTLVLLKPDAIQRSLMGKIITRFEDTGLKIVAMRLIWAEEEIARNHYPLDEEWAKGMFEKTKASYEKAGKKVPYKTHVEMGKTIQKRLVTFLKESPVLALVLEGPHAVEIVRKMVGSTEPKSSAPGTIRGDFSSVESYAISDKKERAARNLIHASDSVENAKREIAVWFTEKEIYNYKKELDKHFE